MGNDDAWLRDILTSYVLDPNYTYTDWLTDRNELTLSLNYRFGQTVEAIRPGQPVPENEPFVWAPPTEGTRLTYVGVDNDEQPVDPMMGAILEIVDWFVNQSVPLPVESTIFDYTIGQTNGVATMLQIADRYVESVVADDARVTLARSTIAIAQAFGGGPELQRSYEGVLESIGPMEVGRVFEGRGILFVECPDTPNPFTIIIGCVEGVERADVGTFDWSFTFEGWEDLLVPARRAVTARLAYEETASMTVMGQTRTQFQHTTWWIDPEINWWLKRENVSRPDGAEAGIVTTLEAMTVEAAP